MSIYNFLPDQICDDKKNAGFFCFIYKNPLSCGAVIIIALVFLMAVFGPVLSPHDPLKTDMSLRLSAPSPEYPFGNDTLGRCVFSRVLSGARMSIGLGISIVVITCFLGVLVGLIAGYRGGLIDELLMRIADIFLSLPEIVAAMTLAGILGPGTYNLVFAFSVTGWMRYARLVRGITLSVKEQDYVKLAQYSGVSRTMIIIRHILPANIGPIIVLATIGMAKAVISVSALGFLGFGVQPPNPEWGTLLMEGKDYILSAPHLSIYPGIAIMLSALAFNLLGDNLRDFWDLKKL